MLSILMEHLNLNILFISQTVKYNGRYLITVIMSICTKCHVDSYVYIQPNRKLRSALKSRQMLVLICVTSKVLKGDGNPDDYYILFERS